MKREISVSGSRSFGPILWVFTILGVLGTLASATAGQDVTVNATLSEVLTRRIFFSDGKHDFSPAATDVISEVTEILTSRPSAEVHVAGHADCRGSLETNERLSRDRARFTANALITAGIDSNRVKVCWYGETRPYVDALNEQSHRWNRRVEIVVREGTILDREPTSPGCRGESARLTTRSASC